MILIDKNKIITKENTYTKDKDWQCLQYIKCYFKYIMLLQIYKVLLMFICIF